MQKLFGGRVFHVYLPYDLPASVRPSSSTVRPRLGVVMETEIWPNLFLECAARRADRGGQCAAVGQEPARLRPGAPVGAPPRSRSARYVAAQSPSDAKRLLELGADRSRLSIVGNLKFDMAVPPELAAAGRTLRAGWGRTGRCGLPPARTRARSCPCSRRTRWCCGVSRCPADPGAAPSGAFPARGAGLPQLRLCHALPQRGRRSARSHAVPWWTAWASCCATTPPPTSPSSAAAWWRSAATTCWGRRPGGAGRGGPNTFNFTEITQSLLEADAAVRVADADALGPTVQRLLGDAADRQRRGAAARAVFERERGAVERSMAIIDRVLAGDAPGARGRANEKTRATARFSVRTRLLLRGHSSRAFTSADPSAQWCRRPGAASGRSARSRGAPASSRVAPGTAAAG